MSMRPDNPFQVWKPFANIYMKASIILDIQVPGRATSFYVMQFWMNFAAGKLFHLGIMGAALEDEIMEGNSDSMCLPPQRMHRMMKNYLKNCKKLQQPSWSCTRSSNSIPVVAVVACCKMPILAVAQLFVTRKGLYTVASCYTLSDFLGASTGLFVWFLYELHAVRNCLPAGQTNKAILGVGICM